MIGVDLGLALSCRVIRYRMDTNHFKVHIEEHLHLHPGFALLWIP